jgi:hypothetical protein
MSDVRGELLHTILEADLNDVIAPTLEADLNDVIAHLLHYIYFVTCITSSLVNLKHH